MKELLDDIPDLPELATVITARPALIEWLGDDHEAALLLSQIAFWARRTKDPEGWFYKTYREWYGETRLSAKQIRRAMKLFEKERVGVQTRLRKVKNAPVLHYRLDVRQLQQWAKGCRASDSAEREQSNVPERRNG